jgi:hypothetical protein
MSPALQELLEKGYTYLADVLVEEWREGREHYRRRVGFPWLDFTGDLSPLSAWAVGQLVCQWAAHHGFDASGGVAALGPLPSFVGAMEIEEDGGCLDMKGHVDRHNAWLFGRSLIAWHDRKLAEARRAVAVGDGWARITEREQRDQ